jgi:ubiquitin carboxyl-terminal hydrolase 25
LRNAVLTLNKLDLKSIEDDKLSDEDLKRHRVGGRLVTRREIVRSKKCKRLLFVHFISLSHKNRFPTTMLTLIVVYQLASLFHELEYAEAPSITPALELAKLALVTSKDEEDDETDKGTSGTDSSGASNDTDATLVEDGGPPSYVSTLEGRTASPTTLSPEARSILGKRTRDLSRMPSENAMDVDVDFDVEMEDKENVAPSSDVDVTMKNRSQTEFSAPGPSGSRSQALDGDGDVIMRSETPLPNTDAIPPSKRAPPLPPRKTDSVMMFGRLFLSMP